MDDDGLISRYAAAAATNNPGSGPLNGGCRVHGGGHSRENIATTATAGRIKTSGNTTFLDGGIPGRKPELGTNRQGAKFYSPAGAADCSGNHRGHTLCPEVSKALAGVMLIAEQKKRMEESTKVRERERERILACPNVWFGHVPGSSRGA